MKSPAFLFFVVLAVVTGCSLSPETPGRGPLPRPPSAQRPLPDGNEGGNGGDSLVDRNWGAWFLTEGPPGDDPFSRNSPDKKSIRVCLQKSESFGVSNEAAQSLIENAAGLWGKYVRMQNIFFVVKKVTVRPATTLQWVGCHEKPDLTVWLGVTNDEIQKAKKHFVDPLAFAWQTKVDAEGGWGRGYLWVAPPGDGKTFPHWGSGKNSGGDSAAEQALLYQTLIHEWGHVLGCDHLPETIMRADLRSFLRADPDGRQFAEHRMNQMLSHNSVVGLINGKARLLHSRTCFGFMDDGSCLNEVQTRMADAGGPHWPAPFALQQLFGKNLPTSLKIEVVLTTTPKGTQRYQLNYLGFNRPAPQPSEVKLVVELPEPPLTVRTAPQLFKMKLGETEIAFPAASDDVINGVTHINGTDYPVLVQRLSTAHGDTKIWLIVGTQRLRLN